MRRAFTLVELLVVIAIIGLLSTVAIIGLDSSRKKARNAKRVADIKQIVNAFSLGIDSSSDGLYPRSGTNAWYCISSACTGDLSGFPIDTAVIDPFLAPYLPNKPADPSDGGSRHRGGYAYNGAWPGGGSFQAGSYIDYFLEPSATCAVGTLYGQNAYWVECLVKLD